jgi:hypothetical protein
MFPNLPEWAKIVIGVVAIGGYLLVWAARRNRHIGWLQGFDIAASRPKPEAGQSRPESGGLVESSPARAAAEGTVPESGVAALLAAHTERRRRWEKVRAGGEMIVLGLAIPLVYGALKMLTWGDFSRGATIGVLVVSACLVIGGVVVLMRPRR